MILADNETRVDLLNNEAIAATIVELMRARPDRPVTIGVHGDWGAGKSSILEMIEAGLEEDEKVLCLKFNGWRFQGFEDAKIALIEGIVDGLIEKRPALTKAADAVKDILRRIDWLKVAKKVGGLAFTAYTGIPSPSLLEGVVDKFRALAADPAKLATKESIETAIEGAQGLLKPSTESRSVPSEIRAFRKAFDELLNAAKVQQLVVLVDDLDRCLPDTAIETLEAIRLFVFTSRTAFVVAADEAMIEYAVRRHFPNLPDSTGPQTYARNYLEKLIQIPFRIPALGETETRIYITLLLVGATLPDDDPAFLELIKVARKLLQQPWKSGALDAEAVKRTLGEKAAGALASLTLSDRIGPVLAKGANGNPRQIKRFLNTLILRQRIADARGFGNEVRLPVLAKLMLAERFLGRFFNQLAAMAAASSDGKCAELAAMEALVHEASATGARGGKTAAKAPSAHKNASAKPGPEEQAESPLLNEWASSPAIRSWAAVQPDIGNDDLRPYLFVAKDRKDYFGATSVLGHLAAIVDQLFSSKMAVQGLEADLRTMAPPEAIQVFEAVRGRIMLEDSFESEPPGVAGLEVLVRAQPMLQGNLLDFLETLPNSRTGPWVCSGWDRVIKDPQMAQRYERLLQTWGQNGGLLLKATAQNVLRTRQGVH